MQSTLPGLDVELTAQGTGHTVVTIRHGWGHPIAGASLSKREGLPRLVTQS
jgi:hypothetical protein